MEHHLNPAIALQAQKLNTPNDIPEWMDLEYESNPMTDSEYLEQTKELAAPRSELNSLKTTEIIKLYDQAIKTQNRLAGPSNLEYCFDKYLDSTLNSYNLYVDSSYERLNESLECQQLKHLRSASKQIDRINNDHSLETITKLSISKRIQTDLSNYYHIENVLELCDLIREIVKSPEMKPTPEQAINLSKFDNCDWDSIPELRNALKDNPDKKDQYLTHLAMFGDILELESKQNEYFHKASSAMMQHESMNELLMFAQIQHDLQLSYEYEIIKEQPVIQALKELIDISPDEREIHPGIMEKFKAVINELIAIDDSVINAIAEVIPEGKNDQLPELALNSKDTCNLYLSIKDSILDSVISRKDPMVDINFKELVKNTIEYKNSLSPSVGEPKNINTNSEKAANILHSQIIQPNLF